MKQRLPSMQELEAFLMLAEGASVVEIAQAMHLTPSAITRRLQGLEEAVGVGLVDRSGARRTVTAAGEAYAVRVAPLVAAIREAGEAARPQQNGPALRIQASPWFFANWISPRLSSFLEGWPAVSIELLTSETAQAEVTIRSGLGPEPGEGELPLVDFLITPFCDARLLEKHSVSRPVELLAMPLIDHVRSNDAWARWFAAAGVPDISHARRVTVDNSFMLCEAALNGAGAAILPSIYASVRGQSGLVRPFPDLTTYIGTAFIAAPAGGENQLARTFRDWLVAELRE